MPETYQLVPAVETTVMSASFVTEAPSTP